MKLIKIGYLFLLALIVLVLATGLVWPLNLKKACDSAPTVSQDSIFTIKEKTLLLEEQLKNKINFRNYLVQWNSQLKYHLFNSSMNTHQAVIGNEDWLYYSSKSDQIIDSYTHQNNLTPQEMAEFVVHLEQREKKLKDRGIQYCHAVWPNKSTVYPEYMPERYRRQKKEGPSKMSEFYEENQESDLSPVDVRAT